MLPGVWVNYNGPSRDNEGPPNSPLVTPCRRVQIFKSTMNIREVSETGVEGLMAVKPVVYFSSHEDDLRYS